MVIPLKPVRVSIGTYNHGQNIWNTDKVLCSPYPTPKKNVVWTANTRRNIGKTGEQQQHCFGGGGVGFG